MSAGNLPVFPYGAVYFRKSNPPREDWERDYRQAAEDGMNAFRHWFLWGAIEVAPGTFDWDDYDRQLDLAARYGITTIIAELTHAAPEWAFDQLAAARYERADGQKVTSSIRNSTATGGFPGLCLDNEEAWALAGNFLTELVNRYKGHPALGAYDVWNECNLHSSAYPYCYCPGTVARFHAWLKQKYGDLKTLGAAWRRYSYTDWRQVAPPRGAAPYPEYMDWVQFRIDNAHRLLRWRVELIRALDPDHPVTAHGVNDAGLRRLVDGADDPWRAAALVDGFGYTGGSSHSLRDDWRGHRWCFTDLHRAAANGKPFWSAELSAGPIWKWWGGQAREPARIPNGEDLRLASLIAMAGGVTGIFSNRWRPLLDGPLFGACAYYDMDGSPTDSSRMAGRIAKWANAPQQEMLWQSRPVRGDIGILVVPETQIHSTLWMGKSDFYAHTLRGVYQGFLASNIQADWVSLDQIEAYDLLYLPCPALLTEQTARALTRWVENGGSLVSEGCPAYFGDGGRAGAAQPNLGLDRLFGVAQAYVEFTPDLLEKERLTFGVDGIEGIPGGLYLQAYHAAGGRASGWYEDGRIAVVDHQYGKGRTRLIGTVPGLGYWQQKSRPPEDFYAGILTWAGKEPQVLCRETLVTARLHAGKGGAYLWLVNMEPIPLEADVELSNAWGPFRDCQILWGESKPTVEERRLKAALPAKDALVVRLM
jgi:beta-galactosidase